MTLSKRIMEMFCNFCQYNSIPRYKNLLYYKPKLCSFICIFHSLILWNVETENMI